MGSLWIRVIIVIAVCGLFDASLASCQTKPSIQLPEFYGTYAIAGGKTASLDSPKDLGPTSPIRMGVRQNLGPILGFLRTLGNIQSNVIGTRNETDVCLIRERHPSPWL